MTRTSSRAAAGGSSIGVWAQLALAALSGLLYVTAFPGFNQSYLAFIAFAPVVFAARDATPRRALLLGLVAGIVSHLIAYFWINDMLIKFGGAPRIVAGLGWLLCAVAQGGSYGVGLMFARWLQQRTGWPWAATLAVGLTAMDFIYPLLFPSYVADTMAGYVWMMQVADLFGVLGLTALLGAINGLVADLMITRSRGQPWPRKTVAVAGGLWALAVVYGAIRTAMVDQQARTAPQLHVGMVQHNVGGFEPPRNDVLLHRTQELSREPVDLVVWPEGAWEGIVSSQTDVRRQILGGLSQPLLFGAERLEFEPGTRQERLFNTAFLSDASGRILGSYDKMMPLAFGEYIPGGDTFPILYKWFPEAGHLGRGHSTAPLVWNDWRIGTFICYEDILPRLVWEIMQPHDGSRPNLMVNITNDSWYGRWSEQEEHLALASFRAVEHHRALVRSTNTGISAIIDPAGRIVARTPTYVETTLTGYVPRMEGTTLYEIIGDAAGYVALALLAYGFIRGRRKARA